MTMTHGEVIFMNHAKNHAIKLFLIRKQNPPEQINNALLQAGEPMYFYCKHCGAQSDVVEEEYLFPIRDVCSQCEGLQSRGWLEEAILLNGRTVGDLLVEGFQELAESLKNESM